MYKNVLHTIVFIREKWNKPNTQPLIKDYAIQIWCNLMVIYCVATKNDNDTQKDAHDKSLAENSRLESNM